MTCLGDRAQDRYRILAGALIATGSQLPGLVSTPHECMQNIFINSPDCPRVTEVAVMTSAAAAMVLGLRQDLCSPVSKFKESPYSVNLINALYNFINAVSKDKNLSLLPNKEQIERDKKLVDELLPDWAGKRKLAKDSIRQIIEAEKKLLAEQGRPALVGALCESLETVTGKQHLKTLGHKAIQKIRETAMAVIGKDSGASAAAKGAANHILESLPGFKPVQDAILTQLGDRHNLMYPRNYFLKAHPRVAQAVAKVEELARLGLLQRQRDSA